MKIYFLIGLLIFFSLPSTAQTEEELSFLDTLQMGGSYLIGKQMPEFKARALNGKVYSRKKLNHKISFINFWFEACTPCISEIQALNELFGRFKHRKKFQFLSITFEKEKNATSFIRKHRIEYPVITLGADLCSKLNFRKGYPTTVITDKQGKIIFIKIGGPIDPIKAKQSIEKDVYPVLEKSLLSPVN